MGWITSGAFASVNKVKVTLIVWTNLTVDLEERQTANVLMLKVLDQIYVVSPLASTP